MDSPASSALPMTGSAVAMVTESAKLMKRVKDRTKYLTEQEGKYSVRQWPVESNVKLHHT